MNNKKDYEVIKNQLDMLRDSNVKTQEAIAAIQLLVVDDNNGRVKDPRLITELESLTSKMQTLSEGIDSFSRHFIN
ncbi:hypothetical protein [Alkaliphilus peptidifermentans]|uniref:Uncharacterized protein n=1 Tax=Alkaliphilus peptidifermentans DSM 18978 TaxID=1120976 RepID=A0A1G5J077_9FIRM|nr:hypothetical protein [Alkaliphilus peptidifermentans]SCY81370.1 hypothetical protein SAMN03080606_02571 [Alkaliphilus peptidifermentans DSM 18978]